MKVNELFGGAIIWYQNIIVGIKGCTLDKCFNDYEVFKVNGNPFDYEIRVINEPERKKIEELRKIQENYM